MPPSNSRIAVIGAGPAGIHMAHLLRARGYRDLTILERTGRIGGKSLTIKHDGDLHELGTAYLSPDYVKVIKLLEFFGLDQFARYKGRTVWRPPGHPKGEEIPFEDWVTEEAREPISDTPSWLKRLLPRDFPDLVPDILARMAPSAAVGALMIIKLIEYNIIHKELFGKDFDGTLPDEPLAPDVLSKMSCSFEQFLVNHDLDVLKPIFMMTQTVQGYGYLDTVPAFYGLLWNTPAVMNVMKRRLIDSALGRGDDEDSLEDRPLESAQDVLAVLEAPAEEDEDDPPTDDDGGPLSGLQRLWRRITDTLQGDASSEGDALDEDVVTLFDILRDDEPGKKQKKRRDTDYLVLRSGWQSLWERIAEVFHLDVRFHQEIHQVTRSEDGVTIRLTDGSGDSPVEREEAYDLLVVACPAPVALGFLDATDEEQTLFSALKAATFTSTLYSSTHQRGTRYLDSWFYELSSETQHTLYSQRHTAAANRPAVALKTAPPKARVAAQYGEEDISDEDLAQRLGDRLEGIGAQDVETIARERFNYFYRFSIADIESGYPWRIREMQGQNRTWFIGSSVSFEAINNVIEYNESLLRRLANT